RRSEQNSRYGRRTSVRRPEAPSNPSCCSRSRSAAFQNCSPSKYTRTGMKRVLNFAGMGGSDGTIADLGSEHASFEEAIEILDLNDPGPWGCERSSFAVHVLKNGVNSVKNLLNVR